MSGYEQELTIPFFYGKIDTEAYLDWEKKMEFLFGLQYYTEKKKVCLAVNGLCGSAFSWWQRVSQTRRFDKKPQIISWVEMKTLMKKRFVSQWKLPKLKPEAATKLTTLDQPAYWSELTLKSTERRFVVPVLSLKQEEEKLQASILASPIKQIEESHKTELEPTTLGLKLEEEAEVAEAECGHVPDQIKQEEKVPGGSSKALELVLPTVEQGDNFKSLACELLIRPLVCLQLSLVEHLRVVKGLQQVVFEPGGSFSVSIRSNNNLVQKTVTYKLDLQGFFTPEKQDLRSNLFEGREDGVILSICSKNRGETGGNTPLIRPITDQNQLRSTKQKLAVVKKMPKLENEYGDHYTRPPDPMQHENQVIMSIGQGVLREIIDILLGSHKELVRPPDQSARFLLVFRDLMLSFYPGEHRTHAETAMVEACLWSKWRKSFAAAAGYELNGKESFVCYILRHVRGLEMIEQGSKSSLKRGKGLQSWVFDPGDDHVSIILQVSDLRTNPFEGREDGVTLISSILKNMKSRREGARKWILTRPDELYGKLKGLIHEVLDREKAMGLDVAFIKHGLTLNNHGRPVTTLIDKEMDRMKLVRQEMEWEIQSDREMDWSNRHMRELSWKWKIENQSRNWNMMRTFIIQMSIRSSLVGPGTRWIEPKKELFEKGLYRPKKWKDKPAWFMIGPI